MREGAIELALKTSLGRNDEAKMNLDLVAYESTKSPRERLHDPRMVPTHAGYDLIFDPTALAPALRPELQSGVTAASRLILVVLGDGIELRKNRPLPTGDGQNERRVVLKSGTLTAGVSHPVPGIAREQRLPNLNLSLSEDIVVVVTVTLLASGLTRSKSRRR